MIKLVTSFVLVLLLTACTETTYPLSGEDCDPGDPVQSLDASDCVAPAGGSGTF